MGCCSCIAGCIKGGIDCLVKAVFMPINGFFAVGGLIICVVAGIALAVTDAISIGSTNGFWISTLCFGAVILCTSALGCVGGCCKSRCLLIPYCVILVGLIIGQIVLVSMANGISEDTKEELITKLHEYDPDNANATLVHEIDTYQIDNKCCGVNNSTDWLDNPFLSASSSLPDSCCKDPEDGCGKNWFSNPSPPEINEDGCYDTTVGFWGTILWGIMIGIIIIQAALVVLAGFLSCRVNDD